jgi:hypothetical protein
LIKSIGLPNFHLLTIEHTMHFTYGLCNMDNTKLAFTFCILIVIILALHRKVADGLYMYIEMLAYCYAINFFNH